MGGRLGRGKGRNGKVRDSEEMAQIKEEEGCGLRGDEVYRVRDYLTI